VESPKQQDGLYQYALGQASGCASREQARQQAFANAVGYIARSLYADVQLDGDGVRLQSDLNFSGVEIIPQGEYYRQERNGWSCWLQVSYPLVERQKIQAGVALGKRLRTDWAAVQSARNSGLWAGVADPCRAILKALPESIGFTVPPEEIKMAIGESLENQTRYGEAWEFYRDVARFASNEVWKGKAMAAVRRVESRIPAHWILRDRWNQRRVVQVCALRDGQGLRPFPELAAVLGKKWTEIGLDAEDGSGMVTAETAVDQGALADAACAAETRARKGGLMITVLYDIDETRRGKKQEFMGASVPMVDTWIKFRVVTVPEGRLLFSGQFKEVAGDSALSHLAERAGSILVNNYLVKQCPAIASP